MPSLILLLIGWFVSKDDPHAIRGLFVAFRTSGFMFDRWLWGGASLSAMPASFRLRHARSI
jgi:type IV secretory pathway VirB3-like protein